MSLNLPYGIAKFEIADPDSVLDTFTPSDTQTFRFVKEPDNQEIEIFEATCTGKGWIILRENNRSWEIEIKGITQEQFENEIAIYRGLKVEFTPHTDEPTIVYDMIMTYCEHSYSKGNYYRDICQITLTPQEYK